MSSVDLNEVVVSGVGIVSPVGFNPWEAWRRMRSGTVGPIPIQPHSDADAFPIFQVPEYDLLDCGVPADALRWLQAESVINALDVKHLLGAVALALNDAGLNAKEPWAEDAGVIVANEHPGVDALCETLFSLAVDSPLPAEPARRFELLSEQIFSLNTFLPPFIIAKCFGLGGETLFVNSACTSGLNAIDIAAHTISSGRADIAIVAGADDPTGLAKFLWFRQHSLYALDGMINPFNKGGGTVFGDGGAALILERRSSAVHRGTSVHGIYRGAGFAQDGWRVAIPNPLLRRQGQAIKRALSHARLPAEAIELVVPHGTGLSVSDAYERRTLNEIFTGEPHPELVCLKRWIGHNLGGSAITETVLMLAAMRSGEFPVSDWSPRSGPAVPEPVSWINRNLRFGMKTTAAFCGYFGAAIFELEDNHVSRSPRHCSGPV